YPDDHEAAAFYALSLIASEPDNDTTFANRKKAGAILEKLFALEPNHPGIAHYLIHTYDKPQLAELGLAAARRYAQIAPFSPHALAHFCARWRLARFHQVEFGVNRRYPPRCRDAHGRRGTPVSCHGFSYLRLSADRTRRRSGKSDKRGQVDARDGNGRPGHAGLRNVEISCHVRAGTASLDGCRQPGGDRQRYPG